MSFVIRDAATHPASATWGGQSVPDYAVLKGPSSKPFGPLRPQRSAPEGLAVLRYGDGDRRIAASRPASMFPDAVVIRSGSYLYYILIMRRVANAPSSAHSAFA
jgi:hypothetical protein